MKRPADIRADYKWTMRDAACEAVDTGKFDVEMPEAEWMHRYGEGGVDLTAALNWARASYESRCAIALPIEGAEPGEFQIIGCEKRLTPP